MQIEIQVHTAVRWDLPEEVSNLTHATSWLVAQNPSGSVNVLSWSELTMHLYPVSQKTEGLVLQDSQRIE